MTIEVAAHSLFSGPDRGLLENVVLRHDNGIISDISAGAQPPTDPRSLVLPAFVNAHDHARPTASSFGALGMPLESWILRSALGTPAARMPQVAGEAIKTRARRLRVAGEAALQRRLAAEVGATRQVLIESTTQGRTEHFLPVAISGETPGAVMSLAIKGHDGARLTV